MKRIDFENGTITGNIIGAALPMLVAQILNLLYNVVDRVYIARIPQVGTAALGAVGLCFPLIVIISAFANLFGSGGAPLFSIYRGQKNDGRAAHIMNTSFTMLCASSIILMAIGLLFAHPLLVLFGASEDALVYAYPYMLIYLIGTMPSMIAVGMNPFINAQGYAVVGMSSVAIGAVSNLILDPLFIFVLGFGVRGAAIATIISQSLSAIFVVFFLRKKSELKVRLLKKNEMSESLESAKNIISLGTAGFIMQLTNSLVSICCNNVLSVTGGDIYISVMTIVSSVRQLVETPIWAVNEGTSPILSYNYGAKNDAELKNIFKKSFVILTAMGILLTAISVAFARPLAGIFIGYDKTLLALTEHGLRLFSLAFIFCGYNIYGSAFFTALNNGVISAASSLGSILKSIGKCSMGISAISTAKSYGFMSSNSSFSWAYLLFSKRNKILSCIFSCIFMPP